MCRVGRESSVFRLPLTFPSVPSSVSLVLIVSSRSLARSLARSCVRACVRTSVGPSNVLSFLSFSLSVASLIPPGVSSVRMIPAARSPRVTYILSFDFTLPQQPPFLCLSQNTPVILGPPCARFVSVLSRAPPRANIRRVPLSSGSVRLKISPSLRRSLPPPPRGACPARWFSLAYIKNPNRVSLRLFSHNSASLALPFPPLPRLLASTSLHLRLSSSVSDSLSAARFPCNKRRCPLPAAVSFFSFSSFSPPLLHHHHPPPSFPLVPLAPVCARAHTHTHGTQRVWLSCDLAIRDTTSTTNERKPTTRRSSCSRGEPLLFPGGRTLRRASNFSHSPWSAFPSRVSLV